MTKPALSAIRIESNIPLPSNWKKHHGNVKYPFKSLKIGDSFEVIDESKDGMRIRQSSQNAKKATGFTFTVRKVDTNKYRTWRIA